MKVWEALRDAFTKMGIFTTGTVTGTPSTTVITDSALTLVADRIIGGSLMIITSTDGLAPQGEFQRISDNDVTTITVGTALSVETTTGDIYGRASREFPVSEWYTIFNLALDEIGEFGRKDTSITTGDSQREYTYPIVIRKGGFRGAYYQNRIDDSDRNDWVPIHDYHIEPGTPGNTSLIIFDDWPAGRTIKMEYVGLHDAVSAFDTEVDEAIHPNLMTAALRLILADKRSSKALQTQNFFNQGYNKAKNDFEDMRRKHPLWMPKKIGKLMILGEKGQRYPGDPEILRRGP